MGSRNFGMFPSVVTAGARAACAARESTAWTAPGARAQGRPSVDAHHFHHSL